MDVIIVPMPLIVFLAIQDIFLVIICVYNNVLQLYHTIMEVHALVDVLMVLS